MILFAADDADESNIRLQQLGTCAVRHGQSAYDTMRQKTRPGAVFVITSQNIMKTVTALPCEIEVFIAFSGAGQSV